MPRAKPDLKPGTRRPLHFAALCVVLGLMTSVGVAWGIVWERDSSPWSGSVDAGISLSNDDPEHPMYITWLVRQSTTGPLVTNQFFAVPRQRAQALAQYGIDQFNTSYAANFASLTNDAASRLALARHLPLVQGRDAEYVIFTVDRAGWPFLALAVEWACTAHEARLRKAEDQLATSYSAASDSPPRPSLAIDPAFNLLPHYNAIEIGDTLLPTFPLWPGLLANTAIYGGAWAVLLGAGLWTNRALLRWLRARRGGCAQCGYSREGLKMDAPCPECGRVPTSIAATASATPETPQTPTV